jgi:hypothetical protein
MECLYIVWGGSSRGTHFSSVIALQIKKLVQLYNPSGHTDSKRIKKKVSVRCLDDWVTRFLRDMYMELCYFLIFTYTYLSDAACYGMQKIQKKNFMWSWLRKFFSFKPWEEFCFEFQDSNLEWFLIQKILDQTSVKTLFNNGEEVCAYCVRSSHHRWNVLLHHSVEDCFHCPV